MKRVLFTHSYFLRFDPKQWQIMQPYAPLGTIQAAALVRNAGFNVRLWDPMFAKNVSELNPEIQNFKPEVLVIYDDGFNYLTKMCLTNMREAAFEMIRLGAIENIPVIVCSSDATDHYQKYIDVGALAVIKGEGELSLLEILLQLNQGNWQPHLIDSLIYKADGKTVVNKSREVMKDLDQLPLPAWDLVNISEYKQAWITKHGYFSMNMSTTRGCPFKCNWCAKPIYGNRYNTRSPESVVAEIEYLQKNYQPEHIWFCDDIFGLKPGWVNLFANLITEHKLKLKYKIQSRVDLLLQENNIESLALSGCETVWMGAESGSQSILDAMDKGTRVEQIYEATRLLQKHGIKPAFFLQFGYPGEKMEDIDKTISMVKELLPDDIGISVTYPLPGTHFYERVKSELQVKTNWSDSDEMAMMFSNTFPSPFYKQLHRYVHKTYRIHQGKQLLKQFINGGVKLMPGAMKRIAGIVYHQPGAWYYHREMKKYSEIKQVTASAFRNEMGVELAFNSVAQQYDDNFTNTASGKLQRQAVHRFIEKKINPSIYPNVLELNCGTGEDAIWMTKKGFRVSGTDLSREMINEAIQKTEKLDLSHPPVFRKLNFNELQDLNEQNFDLVFSNFGGLNCASPEQIRFLAKEVNQLLRPGGKLIAVVMGRNCLMEGVYFKIKNHGEKNRRKSTQAITATISSVSFPVWYYSPGEIAKFFEPWFGEPELQPVGFFVPPSWLNNYFSKSKLIVHSAGVLEKLVVHLPSLADYSDHYLIELTKK